MTRRLPSLKQLRAFETTARHESFKLAAEELSVTQAAVSHQIKALEEFFGCRLFNRLNRKVALTEAAANLAEEIGEAFDCIERASSRFRSEEMSGTIRVSVTPFYANRMILPYLDEFLNKHPGLQVEFDYSYRIADFSESALDGAVRYGVTDPKNTHMRLIHLDRVAPVTSPSLVRGLRLPLTTKDIAKLPVAAVSGQERYWHQWFEAAGLPPQDDSGWSRHEQRALALDYALAGNAIALADMPLIRRELETGSLVCLSEIQITLDRGIHLAVVPAPFTDARLDAFGHWLKQQVARFSSKAKKEGCG
jgi:LysR family glycine cleavage system transcriptional activator